MKVTDFVKTLERYRKNLKVGLALSSGSARGKAHVGVVKAIVEREIPIDMIAGASAGAIVLSDELEKACVEAHWHHKKNEDINGGC